MAKPKAPTSYELLGQRISRVINSPRAQSERCAEISRGPDESPDDWERLLEEIDTQEHVDVIPLEEDGEAVRIRWNPEAAV